jgi:hypothetical protein
MKFWRKRTNKISKTVGLVENDLSLQLYVAKSTFRCFVVEYNIIEITIRRNAPNVEKFII